MPVPMQNPVGFALANRDFRALTVLQTSAAFVAVAVPALVAGFVAGPGLAGGPAAAVLAGVCSAVFAAVAAVAGRVRRRALGAATRVLHLPEYVSWSDAHRQAVVTVTCGGHVRVVDA